MTIQAVGLVEAQDDRLEWPEVQIVAPRRYELLSEYRIEWTVSGLPRQCLTVPVGFVCDGASVPAFLEWYLGRERILPAAVPHEWQYAHTGNLPEDSHLYRDPDTGTWKPANHVWTREECDRFFARNLRFCCDIRNGQRRNAYRAIRWFGWMAWRQKRVRLPTP